MSNNIDEYLNNNICLILCDEDACGTGFFITSEYILTASHVLDTNKDIFIKLGFQNEKVILYKNDEKLDIAILKYAVSYSNYIDIEVIDIPIKRNQDWLTKGFPSLKEDMGENTGEYVSGKVHQQFPLDTRKYDIELNFDKKLTSYEGLSGAPLIINNKLVGIITNELPDHSESVEFKALSINHCKNYLNDIQVSITTENVLQSKLPLTITNHFLNQLKNHYSSTCVDGNIIKTYAPNLLSNNEHDLQNLIEELYESIYSFVGNRIQISSKRPKKEENKLLTNFKNKFSKDILEELVGYNFLESDLKAPKIFTSIENGNSQYGIHLHEKEDMKTFVLLLPKIEIDIHKAIADLKILVDQNKFFKIDSSMVKEDFLRLSFNEQQQEYIKSLIFPSETPHGTHIERAFGLFIGFDLDEIYNKDKLKNKEFMEIYQQKILDISKQIEVKIKNDIINEFTSTYYFIYILPFFSSNLFLSEAERLLNE